MRNENTVDTTNDNYHTVTIIIISSENSSENIDLKVNMKVDEP